MTLGAVCRVAAVLICVGASPALADGCEVPEALLASDADLPAARARVASGKPLSILIVTSAKPGPAGSLPGFPTRLPAAIARAAHGVGVEAAVLNLPRMTAPEMLGPMARAVAERRPALVVWQTGTVDAMVSLDVETFGAALGEGIATIHRLGADAVVMDMQYSPQTAQLIDLAPYAESVTWASRAGGAMHFPRHAIMRHWVDAGRVDFGDGGLLAKEAAYDFVHRCLARLLGGGIAARLERPPQAE